MSKSLLRTEVLEYEGGTITVQCNTILTLMQRDELQARLAKVIQIQSGSDYLTGYCEKIAQTTVFKGFGFVLPAPSASTDEHTAAFEKYIRLPLDLITAWVRISGSVNQPPGTKPELQPGVISKDPLLSSSESPPASE